VRIAQHEANGHATAASALAIPTVDTRPEIESRPDMHSPFIAPGHVTPAETSDRRWGIRRRSEPPERGHFRLARDAERRRTLIRFGVAVLLAVLAVVLVWKLLESRKPEVAGPDVPNGIGESSSPARLEPVSPSVARARDELAARPMPDTGTGHAYGAPELSTRDPGTPILLPPGHGVDDLGVATGFPRTPEGALAQLAAIDTTALQSASLSGVRAVIRQWAAPGGPTTENWSAVRAMAGLLERAGVSGAGSPDLRVEVSPAMGLIKGMIGSDYGVFCIDFTVDITLGGTTRTAAVDCQRMVWAGDRWIIGPGPEPAPAPSVWPDTDAAISAGYRDLDVTRPQPSTGQAS
jgi:hypothetical protein